MTEAEKYLLSLGKRVLASVMTTADGTHLCPRIVMLQHNEKLGFFIYTKTIYRKISLVERNPNVTLSITAEGNEYFNVVAHCTARVSDKKEELDLVYNDSIKAFGYTGREDPRLRLIIFTIHSVTHGDKVYQGVKPDPNVYNIKKDFEVKELSKGPFQDKEAMKAVEEKLKVNPNVHLITWNNMYHEDRMMETHIVEGFGLCQATGSKSPKIKQIEDNPNVSLLLFDDKTNTQAVVDAICEIKRDQESKNKVWNEGLSKVGYTKTGDMWVVLLFHIRNVVLHDIKSLEIITYTCTPSEYDKNTNIMLKATKDNIPMFLITVDKENKPKTRMMERLNYHPAVGFYSFTKRTNKTEQMNNNNNVLLIMYDSVTYEDFEVEAKATLTHSEELSYAVWNDYYKNFGYSGPDDENIIVVRYTPTFVKNYNAKAIIDMCH